MKMCVIVIFSNETDFTPCAHLVSFPDNSHKYIINALMYLLQEKKSW